jgi:serine-type D-Ala-D-Ala carboxypeptidase (penicillin-binding protein 5/6)
MKRLIKFFKKTRKEVVGGVVLILVSFLFFSFFIFQTEEEVSVDYFKKQEEVSEKDNYPKKNTKSEDLDITARAAISVYYKDGKKEVLYQKNKDEVLPIASISKLMTAVVVLEEYNTEEEVQVSGISNFKGWEETKIYDVLSQMIVESDNVSAGVFAMISHRFLETEEGVTATDRFVQEMNSKAEKTGLQKTNFINPSGLDGSSDYNKSTAEEVVNLSIYILENQKEIFEISKKPTYYIYSSNGLVYYKSTNTNFFIHQLEEEWQERIVGGKTGTTFKAGQCLLLVLESPDSDGYLINLILGSEDRFKEMNDLINYINKSYEF